MKKKIGVTRKKVHIRLLQAVEIGKKRYQYGDIVAVTEEALVNFDIQSVPYEIISKK